ncbi:MAG: translation initiation factor eIF-2B [Ktedonobacteraceae bacterium]|nr:translation initiation factor eIF-2B [Ktedonobacteraceae bacterium]
MQEEIRQRIDQVRNDREHGSRWLVREAVLILRDLARTQVTTATTQEQMRLLLRCGKELAGVRPAMAALSNAVSRVLYTDGPAAGPQDVARAAERLLEDLDTAPLFLAAHALPYMRGQLMTCSISGTVLEVLTSARQHIERVIVLEGRPRYEGRETARVLSQQGIPVTLITDAQAAIFLPQCQGIVVGADSVLADGSVLNKAGTALLAWAGQGYHVPLYVLCETLKISARSWPHNPALAEGLLEEKEPEEVLAQPLPGVTVRNFYFDHTPASLVSRLITEKGILQPQEVQQIAAEAHKRAEFLATQSP